MNCNNYTKIVHASLWFGDRIALAERVKDDYHKGFWSDAGGKVEKGESLLQAVRREVIEETDLHIRPSYFKLIDCFIYPKRELKTFLFEVRIAEEMINYIKCLEPTKQSFWRLFTIEQALKLKLMPSVRYYLGHL